MPDSLEYSAQKELLCLLCTQPKGMIELADELNKDLPEADQHWDALQVRNTLGNIRHTMGINLVIAKGRVSVDVKHWPIVKGIARAYSEKMKALASA
jgi:hypothetical protein